MNSNTNLYLNIIFSIACFIVILMSGVVTFKNNQSATGHSHKHNLTTDALATGIFLGMALMHMLPEASWQLYHNKFQYPLAYFIMSITFLIFLWLEHWAGELYHKKNALTFTLIAWLMLSIHSFFMGITLGLAKSGSLAWMLFLGIILHKWAESFGLAQQINKLNLKKIINYFMFISYAIFTPLGIMLGTKYQGQDHNIGLTEPIILAFSSGIFLYLGTLHGLDRCIMLRACCNLRDYSLVILGFLIMSITS